MRKHFHPIIAILLLGALLLLAACTKGGNTPSAEDPPDGDTPSRTDDLPEAGQTPSFPDKDPAPLENDPPAEPADSDGEETPAPPPDAGEPQQPEVPDPPETVQPEALTALLDRAGYALEDIPGQQLIVVRSSGSSADIYAFEADGSGAWSEYLGKTSGHVGRNGVSKAKAEGDGTTPVGLFPLPSAFGVEADPGCLLPYRQAGENSCWVDDPDSAYYNQWAEESDDKDWDSAEHLRDYPTQYAYAAVIGYNMDPVTPGAGSAIFLHCGGNPTSGCVSLAQSELLKLLTWLDPARNPRILIF